MKNFFRAIIPSKFTTKSRSAFTLIELSIVILIASILITGLMTVSVNSINNSNIKTSHERMKEIYKAIGNFVLANKRMPCPASLLKIKSVDSDYGTEIRTTPSSGDICGDDAGVYKSGDLFLGMLPVKALGLSNDMAEDGFGSKFTYIVDQKFAGTYDVTVTFTNTNFSTATNTSSMTIQEKSGTTQTITTNAIMAIISHGSNKAGAFNANSNTQNPRSSPVDNDEAENDYMASFNSTLISSSTNSDVFDDIVFFKQRNNLVEDFDLMFLIPCQHNGSALNGFANKNAYYGQVVYGNACATPANGSCSKKCEAYGTWIDVIPCPCP